MKKLVVAVMFLVGAIGPCFAQVQTEGLTQDKSPPPAKKLYEDDLLLPDDAGKRPCHGGLAPYCDDPLWRQYPLFYEYFDGDTGRGCGASHQTGWTSLVAKLLRNVACAPRKENVAPSKAPRDEQALV